MPTQIPQYGATSDPIQIAANKANLEKNLNALNAGATDFDKKGNWVAPKISTIVGSNDPLTGKQISGAVINAGNAITAPQNQPQSYLVPGSYVDESGKLVRPGDSGYKSPSNGMTDIYGKTISGNNEALDLSKKIAERTLAANQLQYSADLASNNSKYASLFNDLKSKYTNSLEVAEQNAVALNPYSMSRGATTATNFKNKITENYNSAAAQLQTQADLAQQQLAAGNYKAYVEIQNSLDKVVMNTVQENNKLMLDFTKSVEQSRQFEVGQKNVAADNFRNLLSGNLLSSADIEAQIKNGSIYSSPMYQEAIRAGYSQEGALGFIKDAAKAQEDKTGLEWAKFQLQMSKAEDAANKQSVAQIQASIINSVSSVPVPRYDASAEERAAYFKNIALRTAGGKTDFRISQDFSNIQTVVTQLGNVKNAINGLSNTDPLVNLIASKMPWAEKTRALEAYANVSAAPLARLFGEKGTLAEGDVNRIKMALGSVSTPSAVRETLFNSLTEIVGEKFYNELANYSYQGYNVSAYANLIDNISSQISNTKVGSVKMKGPDGKQYNVPTNQVDSFIQAGGTKI